MSMGLLTSTLRAVDTIKESRLVRFIGISLASVQWLPAEYGSEIQKKTRFQMIRISAAVCGIELCYAAETAFVSPVLLRLGVPVAYMTLVWCLSPLMGFFLVPLLGSLSDRCKSRLGRRRPFILVFSVGIILGLIFIPNGEHLGTLMGDLSYDSDNETVKCQVNGSVEQHVNHSPSFMDNSFISSDELKPLSNTILNKTFQNDLYTKMRVNPKYKSADSVPKHACEHNSSHVIGIFIIVIGVALLDFNCDACQSPCRAYLLDISVPTDHTSGLTTFTIMAGLGGSLGYVIGGINWHGNHSRFSFNEHLQIVFSLVLVAFILCVGMTLTSFKEVLLDDLEIPVATQSRKVKTKKSGKSYTRFTDEEDDGNVEEIAMGVNENAGNVNGYGSLRSNLEGSVHGRVVNTSDIGKRVGKSEGDQIDSCTDCGFVGGGIHSDCVNDKAVKPTIAVAKDANNTEKTSTDHSNHEPSGVSSGGSLILNKTKDEDTVRDISDTSWQIDYIEISTDVTLKTYLTSIVKMPRSIFVLCLTNLFCWMSLLCYSLYFTDFVGQSVYGGDPKAPRASGDHRLYEDGVRMGSLSMAFYSLSCSVYSIAIDFLIRRYGMKRVYICGQLVYTVGMIVLAISRTKTMAIMMSVTAGIMYATLFTMPYLIVAKYHATGQFSNTAQSNNGRIVRGLGTDVAMVSSMVFLAQFLLSLCMGSLIQATGSTTSVIITSSVLSLFGAISASQVIYIDI